MINSYRLLYWEKWEKWFQEKLEREPEDKERFCFGWLLATFVAFPLDVFILYHAVPIWLELDIVHMIMSAPVLLIPLLMSFQKAMFLHMLWLAWQVERLHKKNKN